MYLEKVGVAVDSKMVKQRNSHTWGSKVPGSVTNTNHRPELSSDLILKKEEEEEEGYYWCYYTIQNGTVGTTFFGVYMMPALAYYKRTFSTAGWKVISS